MKFSYERRPHRPREVVVPMINVVFLLLIFFMLTAVVATPPPIDLRLPSAIGPGAKAAQTALYLGPDGELAFGDARGSDALAAAAAMGRALDLRVDARLPASDLAGVLAALGEAGVTDVRLVTFAR